MRLWSNHFQVASASSWSRRLPQAQPTLSWQRRESSLQNLVPLLAKPRTGVGATTEADAGLWCARLTSASAQELDCFWIINYRARFTPFACHSLHFPSFSFVCTQIPNVHFSFHTSLWAQPALAGLMIPSEMQIEAFEGERQLIQAFVCTKKSKRLCNHC